MMASYPINLETFSKIVGNDDLTNIDEADISKQINFETKNELISLISYFLKEIIKQKEKEILDASKSIKWTLNHLNSSLKKINLFANNILKLSEALLSSNKAILNALYMSKEEAIYSFTKYIYKSDRWFQKDSFINESEICHYCNLNKKVERNIETKIDSACYYEIETKSEFFMLKNYSILYIWEILNEDLKFLENLYGENGKYSFIWKYEPYLDKKYNEFLTKYNCLKERYLPKVDIIQQKLELNSSDRSNCIYSSYSWNSFINIMVYNVVSKSFVYKTLKVDKKISESKLAIKLPDFNLFLYRENFYIVDTLNFSIKMIASPINHKFANGVYYENCIYLFERNETLKHHDIYKYNLVSNKLSKLSTLAEDLIIASCVIYKNSILIAWLQQNDIYKYDINIESFSQLPLQLPLARIKYFLSNDEKLFLINEGDKIYENQDDEYNWFPVCKCDSIEPLEMPYIWKKDKIYFWSTQKFGIYYYKLNLKSKRLIYKVID